MWPRRRRLYPVELDRHLTSPTSRESHTRTHALTHARASTQVTDLRTRRRAPAAPARSATRSRAPDARERQVTGAKALNGAITEEERRATRRACQAQEDERCVLRTRGGAAHFENERKSGGSC